MRKPKTVAICPLLSSMNLFVFWVSARKECDERSPLQESLLANLHIDRLVEIFKDKQVHVQRQQSHRRTFHKIQMRNRAM
jgi:hypothetical protein